MSRQGTAAGSTTNHASPSRRALLYATSILLVLMLVLSVAAHLVELQPAALVGFPVMMIGATALILTLLYLAGSRSDEASASPIQSIVDAAMTAAVAVDPRSGRLIAANEDAEKIIGPARLIVGHHFSDLFDDGSPEECRRMVEQVARQPRVEVDACTMRTPAGEPVVVRLIARSHSVGDDNFVVVGFARNEASDAIAQFARVQERLMSNISHELRTPLNVVMGFSELLTTGTLGEMPENQLDAAAECHEGGERILRLINDILDVGRSRSYYLAGEERPISPVEMIRRMENLLAGQARRESLQIEMQVEPGLPPIEVEERAFKQLIYHLILNSMDRSEAGGVVRIHAREEGGVLALTITDTGRAKDGPIRAGTLPDMADAESRETLAPPLLGLPLCGFLAERLGATLTAATDEDGVHFEVRLPYQRT